MPQFLRAVHILCALYKYYLDAVGVESSSPIINSVPSSPLSTSVPNSNLQEPNSDVRRVGSYGSLLDSPRSRGGSGRSRLRSFRGHRRSHSQTNPPRSGTNSGSHGSNTSPSSPPSQSHSDTIPIHLKSWKRFGGRWSHGLICSSLKCRNWRSRMKTLSQNLENKLWNQDPT